MPLDVVGAGFGRTGTLSLKLALEQLGFGPCYHMVSVLTTPGAADHWARAARGESVDWESVFAGYHSTTDWPACDYWGELIAKWPTAKVILTVRDPDAWFRSTQSTIFGHNPMMETPTPLGETMRAILERNFEGRRDDRERSLARFAAHNAEVIAGVPADRLLVFDVAEGWPKLCDFLGVPAPDAPFPHSNTTDEFRAHVAEYAALQPGG